ncbi:unnamed protein product [Didymodactylos carnosus]|uniref:1,4-dihydroxy-2-naphthoate octaprenyltransferase n=1 Tax=Didymodactylos carnosus TaxID=1234261 RepID=A0A814BC42_9BILA|nr:unnamed protein product [Didymodactylos carnosus]CAF0926427.1 unnamed protein product [Didymodactylos carnosus]CAF3567701.1 unnamed protein product [Didymodactylos carnosus]CAF3704958.1 unnamed protein product [Didymodactylos carnosus]
MRPWSFSASLMPVLLGSALAYPHIYDISIILLILTGLSALCVHAAGNLFNTYYDFKYGVDEKIAKEIDISVDDDRTLTEGLLKPDDVIQLGLVLYGIGTFIFLILTYFSPAREPYLGIIFFGALPLSFLYTGGIGFKYIAMGDILILLTFGPITVLYSFISQSGYYNPYPVLYALPLTLNTEAILHSNNTRDMLHDHAVGILTLSILIGKKLSYYFYCLLIYLPYLMIIFIMFKISWLCFLPLLTLGHARQLCKEFRTNQLIKLPNRTAQLNFQLGSLYILSIVLTNTITTKQQFL